MWRTHSPFIEWISIQASMFLTPKLNGPYYSHVLGCKSTSHNWWASTAMEDSKRHSKTRLPKCCHSSVSFKKNQMCGTPPGGGWEIYMETTTGPAVIVMVMDYLKENSDFLFIHRDVSILYEEHALILKCLYNRKNGSLISLSLQFVHLSRCSLYQNVNYKMKVHYNMLKLSLYFTFVALTVWLFLFKESFTGAYWDGIPVHPCLVVCGKYNYNDEIWRFDCDYDIIKKHHNFIKALKVISWILSVQM